MAKLGTVEFEVKLNVEQVAIVLDARLDRIEDKLDKIEFAPTKQNQNNPTCRGSFALDTACKKCPRCVEELTNIIKQTKDNLRGNTLCPLSQKALYADLEDIIKD